MIDLSTIPAETLIARGEYSTVRAAHIDEIQRLQALCGMMALCPSQVLRRMQPDNDDAPQSVSELIATARKTMDEIEACAINIETLAKQRAEIKHRAWHK